VKRLLKISTLLSAIGFCFLVIIWPVSYYLNLSKGIGSSNPKPSDCIPISSDYHLGFEDGETWVYNYAAPYRGSIMAMTSPNDPPPVEWFWHWGDCGFGHALYFTILGQVSERGCDFPGLYFRRIWHQSQGNNPAYTTLGMSLWYPVLLLAVLPALWFYSHRYFWFRKP
jgi:hypothetical protein